MAPILRNRIALALVLVVVVVGGVEAALDQAWDLAVVFALAALLQIVVLVSIRWRRPSVPVRRDLAEWLDDRAAATGESIEQLTDRCLATYRAGLGGVDEEP